MRMEGGRREERCGDGLDVEQFEKKKNEGSAWRFRGLSVWEEGE